MHVGLLSRTLRKKTSPKLTVGAVLPEESVNSADSMLIQYVANAWTTVALYTTNTHNFALILIPQYT